MKLLKKAIICSTLALSIFSIQSQADAATTHIVQKGDTFWNIGKKYGVSVNLLKEKNNRTSNLIYIGETLRIPTAITSAEKHLLARLVHAEAKGESYAGKVAVATVVLNRVDSPLFPNTVESVIYERSTDGHYAFTPVQNGTINEPADEESLKAVKEAVAFRGMGKGSLYFYNPKTAKSDWILTREVTTTIGNHRFAK